MKRLCRRMLIYARGPDDIGKLVKAKTTDSSDCFAFGTWQEVDAGFVASQGWPFAPASARFAGLPKLQSRGCVLHVLALCSFRRLLSLPLLPLLPLLLQREKDWQPQKDCKAGHLHVPGPQESGRLASLLCWGC